MSLYDFQQATSDRIAQIFRNATVGADGREILRGGQRRVLLADEVGLGKTHVAAEVIKQVRELRRTVSNNMFRVVYVCSNMSIANQNIRKLGIENKADVAESRLSMQHLTIREREAALKESGSAAAGIIIPLTPSTSFALSGTAAGMTSERALIAQILVRMDEFKNYRQQIFALFQGRSKADGWSYWLKRYDAHINAINHRTADDYMADTVRFLRANPDFGLIRDELLSHFGAPELDADHGRIINRLRRIFADLSLSMLEPDLIIMDEFQRFSSLLDFNDDSEQTAIARKFFNNDSGRPPMILLMSATPYKPYSTLEELTEYNADTHYEDFNRLMDFLFSGARDFREVWSDYSHKLSHISVENFDILLASKKIAQDKMYSAMCRTERLNEGLLKEHCIELPIGLSDTLSFCEMQRIVQACKAQVAETGHGRFNWSNMPVDYVKSAPYLLSFMDSYELSKQIGNLYSTRRQHLPTPSALTLLRRKDLENFHHLPMRNARMEYLCNLMLPKGKSTELLLWVPSSRPYYSTNADNPFVKNADFSKMLIFSAWEMVPRAISVLMTYELERRVIFSKYRKAAYGASTGSERLKDDAKSIITEPSPFLASLYRPEEWYGKPLHIIRAHIRRQIEQRVKVIPRSGRRNYSKILSLIRHLDNPSLPAPEDIPATALDMLTDMAIASPGVCLYRILKHADAARKAAVGFCTIFNRRVAGYIIDKMQEKTPSDVTYLEGVMDYCVMGNLQAVLDEYAHMCGEDFAINMSEAFIGDANLLINTDDTFGRESAKKMAPRISYAVPFAKNVAVTSDKTLERSNNIRCAFQSPFYPFIVASTSVGQEGLDFHWYCRKVMHWNLPSNPQDLEQREGRINRYKCLAIRRNLARFNPGLYDWDSIFREAHRQVRTRFADTYSDMVPFWCLPTQWLDRDKDSIEWIERIVPMYPESIDNVRYKHLIKVLSLYRLTMGQPRQEELLRMISHLNLTPAQIRSLLFNLSPISAKQ